MYLSVLGLEGIRYIIDAETEDILFFYNEEDFFNTAFDGERGLIFKRENENLKYFDIKGLFETDLGIDDAHVFSDDKGNGYCIYDDKNAYFYKGASLQRSINFKQVIPYSSDRFDVDFYYTDDGNFVWVFFNDYDGSSTTYFKLDLKSIDDEMPNQLYISDLKRAIFTDGERIYWTGFDFENDTLYSQAIEDEQDLKTTKFSYGINNIYAYKDDIIVWCDSRLYHLEKDFTILKEMEMNTYIVYSITDNGLVLIEQGKPGIQLVKDGEYKECMVNEPDGQLLLLKKFKKDTLYMVGVGENHISTYKFHSSEYIKKHSGECKGIKGYMMDESETNQFKNLVLLHEEDIADDRIFDVYLCENADYGLIHLWDGQVRIYNSKTGELVRTIYSMEGMINSFYYDKENDYYYISANHLEVYDKDFKNIYRVNDCNLHGFDENLHKPVVARWENGEVEYYVFTPLKFKELLSLADEYLLDFEPDKRVKEKYGL